MLLLAMVDRSFFLILFFIVKGQMKRDREDESEARKTMRVSESDQGPSTVVPEVTAEVVAKEEVPAAAATEAPVAQPPMETNQDKIMTVFFFPFPWLH